jgi:myosin VI
MDDGKKVWIPHALDGFKLGRIVDIGADGAVVELLNERPGGQRVTAPFDRVFPADEYDDKHVDDNCELVMLVAAASGDVDIFILSI